MFQGNKWYCVSLHFNHFHVIQELQFIPNIFRSIKRPVFLFLFFFCGFFTLASLFSYLLSYALNLNRCCNVCNNVHVNISFFRFVNWVSSKLEKIEIKSSKQWREYTIWRNKVSDWKHVQSVPLCLPKDSKVQDHRNIQCLMHSKCFSYINISTMSQETEAIKSLVHV